MARHPNSHSVYCDNEVWQAARDAGLNISEVVEAALRKALVEAGGYDVEIALIQAKALLDEALDTLREQT